MNYNIVFSLSSFFYISLIAIIYFAKQRVKNKENTVYSLLIVSNIIGLAVEVFTAFCGKIFPGQHLIEEIFLRLIVVYFITWISLFSYYVTVISGKDKPSTRNTFKVIYGIFLITSVLLPLHVKRRAGVALYSYGPSIKFLYIATLLYVLYIIFILLTNFKNIKTRKYIPIIIYFVFGTLAAILQMINPQLLITSSIETFITILMYHTIENPDVTILRQLNMEKNRADKANNAKTEFLSSMSHEIRTPLNAIDGFSQLILEENDINVIKEEARDIMSASQNLLEIVNGILDISKIEANKLEIVNVEYEPTKIFEDVSKLAKTRIGNKPVKLITNIAPDLPDYLNGDYGRIKQITLNLLTNAVKYTKEGYVDYSVKCVRKDNVCRLIIIVKDTGIGIKKENIDKLFNKFERFDSQNNITIEGTGLGLAITKKLVDLMNGKIVVDSVYGKGSLFGVSIDQIISPRTKDQKSVENTAADTLISYNNRKVLIVDDNKVNLKVASKLLETFGVSSDCVSSGDECISKINDGFIYDLILMDDMMPGKSGTETFKLLKQNPDFHIPVVVLTANAIEGMRENYIKEGFNDYISKPIDKKELERVLNIYLN